MPPRTPAWASLPLRDCNGWRCCLLWDTAALRDSKHSVNQPRGMAAMIYRYLLTKENSQHN